MTTAENITLNGTQIIDGIAVVADDRVLVKNQTIASENGIYLVKAGSWVRANDINTGLSVSSGIFTFVKKGTLYGNSGWVLTTNSGTVGTDDLTFSQFSGAGSSITASGGLTINGSGDIVLDTPSNVKSILNYITSSDLESFNGSANINELGTITNGTMEGTKITDAYINSATTWNAKQNALTFGISDTNSIIVDGAASSSELAKFTSNGLEGITLSELKNDLALTHSDIDLSSYSGSSSITTLGTITSGRWQGTKINDSYINSAATWNAKQDSLTFGISDTNSVIVDGAVSNGEFARFTANGLEGRTLAELKSDLSLTHSDIDLSLYVGSASITTTGTITSGTWEGTKIIDNYINSAAIWNAKQDELTNGILNTNNVVINSSSVENGDYAKFTSSGLEGRSISELKNDLSLTHNDIDLSSYNGSSSITALGTITSGSWQGSAINESYIDSSIARKSYVDSVAQGLDIKDAVKVTTTANITLSGTQIIDGIAVIADDRVLVKNQSVGSENGIYLVKAGSWVRASDLDTGLSVSSGIFTFIEKGSVYGSSGWVLTTNSGAVGTDVLTFSQFSGAGSSITASGGLTVNGSGDIVLDTPSNVKSILNYIDNSDLQSFNGSTNIVELGTITSGIWHGSKITDTYINSATTWNNKQNALTFGISDTNSVVIDGSASNGEFAKFTSNGLEGRSISELKE